jgi:hypothetical protein
MTLAARWRVLAAVVALLAVAPVRFGLIAGITQAPLPPIVESFITIDTQVTAPDRQALLAGGPLIKLLRSNDSTEVAVFGGIWVNAAPSLYVAHLNDIEQFERGGAFRVTKRIGDSPSAADFAELKLPRQDLDDLKDCRIDDCALRLDADTIQTLREGVDWSKPTARADANSVFRRFVLKYVHGYREGGNERLPIYRHSDHPVSVASEFRSMIERSPDLATGFPDLRRYLLEYPQARLPHSTSLLYWQEVQFGLRPTIRVNHLVIQERGDLTVVASKLLYASHYFRAALETRVLLVDPARGPGFWLLMVNRGRSGGLSGFIGGLIRGRVRNEAQDAVRAALTATKTKLESSSR